jgi:hypothetical protein
MTIVAKLKLDKYNNMAVINQPEDYHFFIDQKTSITNDHDCIFIFIRSLNDMMDYTKEVIQKNALNEKGYLFFAYPKKGNKRYDTSIHRDDIFPAMKVGEDGYVGDSDIKFARMVGMDHVFTVVGLKREKKKPKKTPALSQCVGDYEDKVKDVETILVDHPNELQFFKSLTPGYKRDWARQIFSAKQQATRDKRAKQMVDILSQGYKTLDLYRQNTK